MSDFSIATASSDRSVHHVGTPTDYLPANLLTAAPGTPERPAYKLVEDLLSLGDGFELISDCIRPRASTLKAVPTGMGTF